MIFKRKTYEKLLEWKEKSNGKSAILLEGARRIGKSTIAETFAQNEYADLFFWIFPRRIKLSGRILKKI